MQVAIMFGLLVFLTVGFIIFALHFYQWSKPDRKFTVNGVNYLIFNDDKIYIDYPDVLIALVAFDAVFRSKGPISMLNNIEIHFVKDPIWHTASGYVFTSPVNGFQEWKHIEVVHFPDVIQSAMVHELIEAFMEIVLYMDEDPKHISPIYDLENDVIEKYYERKEL